MFYFFCRSILSSVLLLSTLRKIQKIFNHYSPRAHRCRQSTGVHTLHTIFVYVSSYGIMRKIQKGKRKRAKEESTISIFYFFSFRHQPPRTTMTHHDPPRRGTTHQERRPKSKRKSKRETKDDGS